MLGDCDFSAQGVSQKKPNLRDVIEEWSPYMFFTPVAANLHNIEWLSHPPKPPIEFLLQISQFKQ